MLQLTDLGRTLAQEEAVNRKAKDYGMVFTRADYEKTLAVPENENSGSALQSACRRVAQVRKAMPKETDIIINAFMDRNRSFDPSSKRNDEIFRAVEALSPMIEDFFRECQPVFGRKYCIMKRDWSTPLETILPEYQQINLVHRVLMFEISKASTLRDAPRTIKAINRDAELRRCLTQMDEWLWAFRNSTRNRQESAVFMNRCLGFFSTPSKELVEAINRNMEVKPHSDYKNLCRTYFYIGGEGFPVEEQWSKILSESAMSTGFKVFAKLPRVKKAFKLRFQLAAIAAYEVGLKNATKPDVVEIADREFYRVGVTAGQSSMFLASVLGSGVYGTPTVNPIYAFAELSLKDKLKSRGF